MARTIKLRLSERVRKVMCLHHYSIRNEKFDWYWVHNFILFNQLLHPQKLDAVEVNAILTRLVCLFRQGYRP
ncbi:MULTISPECIES: phage integrase N-terminal SAM-like domain-containing protein [Aeromonas]|uniref:phage integrase N-terminal SAM-like domain-containing protein n=1 Tax=Aeromonas TaxID=642 RepID=UPI00387E7253